MKFGIFLGVQISPEESLARQIEDSAAQVRAARDAGFDLICTGQHFLSAPYAQPATLPFLARMAAEAGDMEVAAAVILAPLHNPVDMAESVATMDAICDGRFIFGVGIGYREEEFAAFGIRSNERVGRLRRSMKGAFAERGVKLTYGPFVYRAVIEALRAYPILNSSVDGARVVYRGRVNIGIAVAVNDGRELIVPVIKDVDQLSLLGLAQRANELAAKARNRALDFDDIQGGTFTITNVGVFGNLFGTPIINQPQVAILGTGVIEKRPVVVKDELGGDVIAIRHRAYFGLSYDHRVVDGAMAAFFLNKVRDYLEAFPEETAG